MLLKLLGEKMKLIAVNDSNIEIEDLEGILAKEDVSLITDIRSEAYNPAIVVLPRDSVNGNRDDLASLTGKYQATIIGAGQEDIQAGKSPLNSQRVYIMKKGNIYPAKTSISGTIGREDRSLLFDHTSAGDKYDVSPTDKPIWAYFRNPADPADQLKSYPNPDAHLLIIQSGNSDRAFELDNMPESDIKNLAGMAIMMHARDDAGVERTTDGIAANTCISGSRYDAKYANGNGYAVLQSFYEYMIVLKTREINS